MKTSVFVNKNFYALLEQEVGSGLTYGNGKVRFKTLVAKDAQVEYICVDKFWPQDEPEDISAVLKEILAEAAKKRKEKGRKRK